MAYKSAENLDQLTSLIQKACPNGASVFFDCAGDHILDAVLPVMSDHGDVILCGATATYNQWKERSGLSNLSVLITKRLRAYGVLYYGSRRELTSAFVEMQQLVQEGHVKYYETVM